MKTKRLACLILFGPITEPSLYDAKCREGCAMRR